MIGTEIGSTGSIVLELIALPPNMRRDGFRRKDSTDPSRYALEIGSPNNVGQLYGVTLAFPMPSVDIPGIAGSARNLMEG
jgi:hypothetical protein